MKRLAANQGALRRMIESGLTVDSVAEDLFCVSQDELDSELEQQLESRGFDRCGVRDDTGVIGYVEQGSVSATSIRDIEIGSLVGETTPLWHAMPLVARNVWMFVLTPAGLTGIVTVADLSKQPSRILMFGIISLLEMTMLALIRQEYPGDDWQKHLTKKRVENAQRLLNQRRSVGQELDLADCLQWCDKASICMKTKRILTTWGMKRKDCEVLLDDLQTLRNQLAHSQDPAPDGGWARVVDQLQQADYLIERNVGMLHDHSVSQPQCEPRTDRS
jgi:hypothetical protein